MYEQLTEVTPEMLLLRDEVIKNRRPRRMFVQHVTKTNADGSVALQTFEPTHKVGRFRWYSYSMLIYICSSRV